MNDKVRKNYFGKANRLIEALDDEIDFEPGDDERERPEDIDSEPGDVAGNTRRAPSSKKSFEMDDEGDVGTETAKAILSTYIDRCVEEGTKELGDDYGLGDIEGSYEIVNDELERIAKQVKNYLKSIQ